MTTDEKLRALLAAARDVAHQVRRGADSIPYAQWSRAQHQADSVCTLIDAALAEPADDYDVDTDLRQHKEDRLRLRVENLRLSTRMKQLLAHLGEHGCTCEAPVAGAVALLDRAGK
jgi:hypothetical protein